MPRGQIVAIVGANGAGKILADPRDRGDRAPRAGRIRFRGREIAGLDSHAICDLGIGQVAEGRQVFPSLTVMENLEMGAMLPRARAHASTTLARSTRCFPRLAERQAQIAGTMSGGEQQMLAIGRCLMGRPELIMFDEPSLGLAPTVVQEVFHTVRTLHERGMTILLVEQNVAVSLKSRSRAYVLENGRVVMHGPATSCWRTTACGRRTWPLAATLCGRGQQAKVRAHTHRQ